jgi:anti-sigma B factor antagonist
VEHDLALSTIARNEGVVTLRLEGVIDAHTLDRFDDGMAKAIDGGATSIVLDCEELRYVNSSGFGEIIRYFDRLRETGGALVLARVAPKVGIVLEMLGLKSLIPIVASLEEALLVARRGAPAPPETAPPEAPEPGFGRVERLPEAAHDRISTTRPVLGAGERIVVCAFCDTRVRVAGEGRWGCPSCGAPFSTTIEGGIAFDWSRADSEAVHLTFDVSPRTMAAFAGLLEGILTERRVSHSRMRRFAREAAHVCHLLAENAFEGERKGPLHVLVLAGPERLHLRMAERGRPLGDESARIFATQGRLFLGFHYGPAAEGVNLTEFAFAYAGSGAFVA